ncbi:MAG: GTPase Era [Holosporales bacterium]|nr:GTPase Era [Holosporales bacterium]
MQESVSQFGFVALAGSPNAGKSTLINCLANEKISAVSYKPQTTRFNILSVKEYGNAQVALVDTPGITRPSTSIGKILRKNASQALRGADVVILVVDLSARAHKRDVELVEAVLQRYNDAQFFLAFNKIDLVNDAQVVECAIEFQKFTQIKDFFMISAVDGTGVDLLLDAVIAALPEHEWMYPPQSEGNIIRWASEMTMEKIFLNLHEEVPYQTYVETLAMQEDDDGLHIYQNVVVAKDGQKPIVLGRRGQMLKQIGTDARLEIAKALRRRVHLHLLVKVKNEWMNKTSNLIDAGFLERS